MPADDDDELQPYVVPGDSERIWFHPSELGSLLPPVDGPPPGHHRRRGPLRRARRLAVPMLTGMAGAALTLGALAAAGGFDRKSERVIERVADLATYDLDEPGSASRLAAAVAPAIVSLRVEAPDGPRVGSGVVFRSDGHVLTNHSLVSGATSVEITFADGRRCAGRAAGADPEVDLAVLAAEEHGSAREPAVLGSARKLQVGEMAVVVGAPSSPQRSPSVTAGVIAGLGEVVEVSGHSFYDLIATDATIGIRASGGPLVDRTGAVIGITTRVATLGDGADRLGLVVPIDLARRVADEIIAKGKVRWAWAGFSGSDLDPATAAEYGATMGTLVRDVAPGGPAQRAGLEAQDVVTAIDGLPISSMHEVTMLVRRHDPGEKVRLRVMRSGDPWEIEIKLGVAPQAR